MTDSLNAVDPEGLLVINIGIGGVAGAGISGGGEFGIAIELPIFGGDKFNITSYASKATQVGLHAAGALEVVLGISTGNFGGMSGTSSTETYGAGPVDLTIAQSVNDKGETDTGISFGIHPLITGLVIGHAYGVQETHESLWEFEELKPWLKKAQKFFNDIGDALGF